MAQATLNHILEEVETLEPEEVAFLHQSLGSRIDSQKEWRELTPEEFAAEIARFHSTMFRLDTPSGADNESIDADLGREYGDDHSSLYDNQGDAVSVP